MSEGLETGDCGVCIGGYDGDGPDFCSVTFPKARKSHQCYECEQEIRPGEKYEKIVGKWDDEISTFEFCMVCSELGNAFMCDGRAYGILWDEIREQLFPRLTTGCLAKLSTVAAKQRLLDEWRKWKFKIPRPKR